MRLPDYIRAVGDETAARQFGVKRRTAASWRRGERRPSARMLPVIVTATRGQVTAADLIDEAAA